MGWAAARLRKRRFHVHRGNLAGMLEPSSNGLPLTIIDCELYGEPYLVLPSPRLIETCCQSARAFLVIRIFRCDASPIHQRRVLSIVSSPSPRQNAVHVLGTTRYSGQIDLPGRRGTTWTDEYIADMQPCVLRRPCKAPDSQDACERLPPFPARSGVFPETPRERLRRCRRRMWSSRSRAGSCADTHRIWPRPK